MTAAGGRTVDVHAHLMPGVDDGPADAAASRRALGAVRRRGGVPVLAHPERCAGVDLRLDAPPPPLASPGLWDRIRALVGLGRAASPA